MDTPTLILIFIVTYLISLWIIYAVIQKATKTKRIILLQEAQVKLLAAIALRLNVDEDILEDIVILHQFIK